MPVLQVFDTTATGERLNTFTLDGLTERTTVRELLRARIYQEVQDHNRSGATLFRGLVQPSETEKTLNGFKFSQPRTLDWKEHYARALDAFARNGFFVLVGDRQAKSLDEEFTVTPETEVSFVKLVPLVGG